MGLIYYTDSNKVNNDPTIRLLDILELVMGFAGTIVIS